MAGRFDVLVIGVGAMGAATCYQLASRGVRVLGIEQFDIAHNRGSSHGESRMIRLAYYEAPQYVPLLRRAYELWGELESVAHQKLLYRTGGAFIGPRDGVLVGGARRAATEHKLELDALSRNELRARWSQFVVPDDWEAVVDPHAGFLLPERAIECFRVAAEQRSARIHTNERVLKWEASECDVRVTTDRDEYTAAELIVCGGAWSSKLLGEIDIPLRVSRQVMGWVAPPKPRAFALDVFPVWGIDSLDGGIYYGFPMLPGATSLKVAHHLPGPTIDPDRESRDVTAADESSFRTALAEHLPDANGPLVSMSVCIYTNSSDGHFIIDRHPQHANVQIACGFSGHGFKFASVIGEILAERAVGSRSIDADFLGLARFGGSKEKQRHEAHEDAKDARRKL